MFLTWDLALDYKSNNFTYRDFKNIDYNKLKMEIFVVIGHVFIVFVM